MPREKLIQLRQGIASNWTSVNPILDIGEKGLETDTLKEKVGDGVTAWNSLAYWNEGGGVVEGDRATITNVIPITNIAGSNYNFNTANGETAYTVTRNSIINQWCQVFINSETEPTLTLGGVTIKEVGGSGWVANTDLYLYLRDLGVDGIHYSFLPKAVSGAITAAEVTTDETGWTNISGENVQEVFDVVDILIDSSGNTLGYEVVTSLVDFDALILASTAGNYLILSDITLDSNKTLPSGVTLYFRGGKINLGGFQLNGTNTKINTGLYQIFDNSGVFTGFSTEKVFPEWFGGQADNLTDNTGAIASCWRFATGQNASRIYFSDGIYLSRCIGNKGTSAEFVGTADLSGLRFEGGSPNTVIKLIAGENTRLFDAQISTSTLFNIRFDGNNPTPAWGGTLNNPSTDVLVRIIGYGVDLDNVVTQFSGGDGMQLEGAVGVFDVRGACSKAWFNWGWGYVLKDNITVRMNSPWVEQNILGGLKLINDTSVTTQKRKYNNIVVNDLYYERVSNYTGTGSTNSICIQIEGTNGVKIINPMFVLSVNDVHFNIIKNPLNSAGNRGSESNYIELGTQQTLNINIEEECNYNRIVKRTVNLSNSAINITDLGLNNSIEWTEIDYASNFSNATGATIYGDRTNFCEASLSNAVIKKGGVFGDIADYYAPNNEASYVELQPSGSVLGDANLLNNEVIPTATDIWIVVVGKMSSTGIAQLLLQDTQTSNYYNWSTGLFEAFDAVASTLLFRTSSNNLVYSFPINTGALSRKIRMRVKYGQTDEIAELYHGFIANSSVFPKTSIRGGVTMLSGDVVSCTTSLLPLATEVREGTEVFDSTTKTKKYSNGTTWI